MKMQKKDAKKKQYHRSNEAMKTMIDQKRENTMKIEAGKDEKSERERATATTV